MRIAHDTVSAVTITLRNGHLFTPYAMAALSMAAIMADEITTTTDDGNVQICFIVRGIHYAAPSFWINLSEKDKAGGLDALGLFHWFWIAGEIFGMNF